MSYANSMDPGEVRCLVALDLGPHCSPYYICIWELEFYIRGQVKKSYRHRVSNVEISRGFQAISKSRCYVEGSWSPSINLSAIHQWVTGCNFEDSYCLNKRWGPWWNAALCSILSRCSLFVKVLQEPPTRKGITSLRSSSCWSTSPRRICRNSNEEITSQSMGLCTYVLI